MNAKCDDCGYEGPDFVMSVDGYLTCPDCGADDVTAPDQDPDKTISDEGLPETGSGA